jgi:hypothetical protein
VGILDAANLAEVVDHGLLEVGLALFQSSESSEG